MKKYFTECITQDEAKNLFRKLCLILHPDKGGTDAEFIDLFSQFKNFKPSQTRDGENENFCAEEFYNTIQVFEGLEGIEISFVGSWIWLEGDTMANKDKIKAISLAGYKKPMYASKKVAWFFSPSDYTQKSKGKKDLNEIKNSYGCKTFKTKGTLKIA
jgi:hypothetical protein